MDSFIKNITKKISVDNIVDMMKDSKVIDEDKVKEEDVRKTLSKLDPNSMMDIDEMAGKLNELSEEVKSSKSKVETSASKKIIDAAKSSISALQKSNEPEEKPRTITETDYLRALGREENVFKLYDDLN